MSPKTADPALRMALIEHAAQLIAEHGVDGLTLRGLAKEVGTSTMAVYTHFGGMDELRFEVRAEAFARLASHLDAVTPSRDPVFDLGLLGWAYCRNALENPNLYRVMFLEPREPDGPPVGYETFETLVEFVDRAMQAGRFDAGDAVPRAREVWALSHGVVALYLAHMLTFEELLETMYQGAVSQFIGFGDDPKATHRSMERMRTSLKT
jgi:AcrR family transcriptional regulator